MSERIPAEVFHVAEYIQEEMDARGWDIGDVAVRMGSQARHDYGVNYLALEMLLSVRDKNLLMGDEMAEGLSRAFGSSKEFWINLDSTWRRYAPAQEEATTNAE